MREYLTSYIIVDEATETKFLFAHYFLLENSITILL